jgi:hypothetical protein
MATTRTFISVLEAAEEQSRHFPFKVWKNPGMQALQ